MPRAALDVPVTAPHVLATMKQTHVNARITPSGEPALAYGIAVPKSWAYSKEFGPVAREPLAPRGLGFFAISTAPRSPVIAVTVTSLLFEIPIDAWAVHAMIAEGWTTVSAKWFPGPSGPFFDITGTRVVDDVEEVRRTTARNDGPNIFCVNCMCGRDGWDAAKEIFWAAHSTFELLSSTHSTRIEPWLSTGAETPDFQVAHPRSWSAESVLGAPEGVSAVDLRLLNAAKDKLLAYVQVKAEREERDEEPAPLDALQGRALAKLEHAGFTPSAPMRALGEDEDPRAPATDGWLGGLVGRGHLAGAEVVARTGFVRRAGVVCSLSMLGPTREDDTMTALRAQRAFEIVRTTWELL
ncbi:MAG TPA: hypothetical protein VGM06_12560 [Polyangiaceae bacterium]|jgi:hypothetical protein